MAISTIIKKKPGDPGYDPLVDGDQGNLFSELKTGAGYLDDAYKTIGSQVSGEAYTPYRTEANQALSRAASSLRQNVGGQFAPNVGQGSAVRAQQGVEQSILENISDTQVGLAQGEQEMKNKGLANLLAMRGQLQSEQGQTFTQGMAEKTNKQSQDWATYEAALNAGDFDTAGKTYQRMTGISLNTDQLKRAQGVLNRQAEQTIESGDITLAGMKQKLGSDRYGSIQNMVNTGATVEQINDQYGAGTITLDQYASMKASSATNLAQQEIDINKFSIQENINIAKGKLALDTDTLALQKDEVNKKYNLLSAEDKRTADTLYGYTDANGNHVMGTLELQNDSNAIQRQGMTLNEAQVKGYIDNNGVYHKGALAIAEETAGREANVLYGFTNPNTGERIPGTLELAKMKFGLDSDTLEEQKAEWKDKYNLMSAEDKRAGDALYGADVAGPDGELHHLIGSMEIADKIADIQAQGLSLEEAQLKGYTDPATGKHIVGNLETAAAALDLQEKTVQGQLDEVYGYTDPATGKYIQGKLAVMDSESQDRAKQLYGYTDQATGQHIPGSLELNNTQVTQTLENQRMQIQNEIAQTQGALSIQDRAMKIQEVSASSAEYWDTAKKLSTYAQTHLDASPADPEVQKQAAAWYEQQFGKPADIASSQFQEFVRTEWKAATDNRLTNPIDQSIYQVKSSIELSDDVKAQMVAILKSIPEGTKFKTDESGNVIVDTGENGWNPASTFDNTNTYASKPAMFAEAGGVWTGEGQQQFLPNGQKITLGTNFGVQNTKYSIPKGNYTVISIYADVTYNPTLLKSEDGTKYYPTASTEISPQKIDFMKKQGYVWNKEGNYFTKG